MTTQTIRNLSPLGFVALCGLFVACSSEKADATYTLIDDMEGTGPNVIEWVPPDGAAAGGWWTTTDCTQKDRIAPPPFDVDRESWTYDELPDAYQTFDGVTSRHAARLRATTPLVGIWGAMVGMNFLTSALREGAVPDCPGTLDFTGTTVDLTPYAGITFWAMAASPGLQRVRVNLRDRNTDPRGGVCNAGNPTADDDCYNDFGTAVALTDTFTQYTVDFASLQQKPEWGFRPQPNVPDLQHVYSVTFQVDLPYCPADAESMCAGGQMQPYTFDFRIDDLYFVNR